MRSAQPESTYRRPGPSNDVITSIVDGAETIVPDFLWTPVATVRGFVFHGGVPLADADICESPDLTVGLHEYITGHSDADGGYELVAPLEVALIGLCDPNTGEIGSISVPMNGATFGQVNLAPDLVVP